MTTGKKYSESMSFTESHRQRDFLRQRKKEQDLLRKEYIANVKKNLRNQLNNIDMVNDDGSVENLGEKYGNKKRNS